MRLASLAAMSIVSALIVLLFPAGAQAIKLDSPVKLTPHRAVYEITLASATNMSGIAGLRGRLVFELGGSTCEGYTVNMRFVTQMTDQQGSVNVNDLRTSTWESGSGNRFRFNSSEYANSRLNQVTSGDAVRMKPDNQINVRVKRPKAGNFSVPGSTLFPTQHSIHLITEAKKGNNVIQTDIYDGSEKGAKIYTTTAIIGKAQSPGNKGLKVVKNAAALDQINSWPISIGYFDKSNTGSTPNYQIAFRLFENGVSRKLFINYGSFAINGSLKKIEFFKPAKCQK